MQYPRPVLLHLKDGSPILHGWNYSNLGNHPHLHLAKAGFFASFDLMARASSLNNLSISRHLSREVALHIPVSHPTDWPHAVAKLWIDRCSSLRVHQANITAWLAAQGRSKQEELRVAEWLICCIPGKPLASNLLSHFNPPRSAHLELMAWLAQVDDAIVVLSKDARWLRQPISDDTLRKRAGCGGTPVGMMAARMGRPHLLVGQGVIMSVEERKGLIAGAQELGLLDAALGLFEEATLTEKEQLSDMAWRGISSESATPMLPSSDPPALWWDRMIKHSPTGEYPPRLATMVQLRPHLAEALAAAMLRSGIREVAALAEAQPGLAMAHAWPTVDGNKLPAMGVVVDTWISGVPSKGPTVLEKMDLRNKTDLVLGRLPPSIRTSPSSKNWEHIAQCLYWQEGEVDQATGDSLHENDPAQELPTPEQLSQCLLSEWRDGVCSAPASAWRRWAEISAVATASVSRRRRTSFQEYLGMLLPCVRQIFLDLYLHARDRSAQKTAEQIMEHLLSLPYRLDLLDDKQGHSNLEWELWTLFTDRSAATSAWRKSKEMTSRPGRTLRQIEKMVETPPSPGWTIEVAGPFQAAAANDENLPDWFQAFLQKEVLRLSGASDQDARPSRGRGRL